MLASSSQFVTGFNFQQQLSFGLACMRYVMIQVYDLLFTEPQEIQVFVSRRQRRQINKLKKILYLIAANKAH